MIHLLSQIPLSWSFYLTGWPRILPFNYTFSLTFKCNSHCLTCNIWQKKKVPELAKNEWRKIFQSLGRSPYFVTFSGGEPFLREDLTEIVRDLYLICQPRTIVIPTNGILTAKIQKDTRQMLEDCSGSRLTLNLSLDGVGEDHDKIRGVKGNFQKAMETFQSLKKIKEEKFTLGIHTVISKANVEDFPTLCDFVLDELHPDSYITEIAEERVELETMSKEITPEIKDYKRAVDYLKQKIKAQKLSGFSKLIQAFRVFYYNLVPKIIEGKTQVIPCYAGVASAQIAPNGDVWPCCVRADVLGNLRQENFDFPKIWFSPKAESVKRSIKNKECFCPLANVSYVNILLSPKSMMKVGRNFLK